MAISFGCSRTGRRPSRGFTFIMPARGSSRPPSRWSLRRCGTGPRPALTVGSQPRARRTGKPFRRYRALSRVRRRGSAAAVVAAVPGKSCQPARRFHPDRPSAGVEAEAAAEEAPAAMGKAYSPGLASHLGRSASQASSHRPQAWWSPLRREAQTVSFFFSLFHQSRPANERRRRNVPLAELADAAAPRLRTCRTSRLKHGHASSLNSAHAGPARRYEPSGLALLRL